MTLLILHTQLRSKWRFFTKMNLITLSNECVHAFKFDIFSDDNITQRVQKLSAKQGGTMLSPPLSSRKISPAQPPVL